MKNYAKYKHDSYYLVLTVYHYTSNLADDNDSDIMTSPKLSESEKMSHNAELQNTVQSVDLILVTPLKASWNVGGSPYF